MGWGGDDFSSLSFWKLGTVGIDFFLILLEYQMLKEKKNIYCMWHTKATLEEKKKNLNKLLLLNQLAFLHIIKQSG